MSSLTKSSFLIHGVNVNFLCEDHLHLLISTSSYFNSLYLGEKHFEVESLEFKLYLVKEPPPLPANAIQVIKFPSIITYSNSKEIYFTSKDGSIICLYPTLRRVQGFLKKGILDNRIELFSLLFAPIVEILKYHGLYSIHSAALYSDGIGYLISGNSGCGKTTTSLSLVREGFKYTSDDFLFLEELNEEVIVHPLYKSFNIANDLAERFPEVGIKENLSIPEKIKVPVDVSQIYPSSFTPYIKPNVIIFPRIVSSEKSQLYPINQRDVYRRLLTQIVLAVDKEVAKRQLAALEKLVKQTVGFELLSGRDIYGDPKRVNSLICRVIDQNGINENGRKRFCSP